MLHHDAAIHNNVDGGGFGTGGGVAVDDSLLDPKVWEAELDHLFDYGGYEFGEAEDVDDVGFER
jgi:hypothetical protein